jgi:hypothetical protein
VLPRAAAARWLIDVRSVLAAIVGALVLAGCGGVGGGGSSSPSPTAPVGFDLVATDNDTAITMQAGEKLELVLHARSGMNAWTNVSSSDTSVLASIVNPAATAARGVTLAAFEAVAPGRANVTAQAGPNCAPNQACPAFLMVYTLTVTVTQP